MMCNSHRQIENNHGSKFGLQNGQSRFKCVINLITVVSSPFEDVR